MIVDITIVSILSGNFLKIKYDNIFPINLNRVNIVDNTIVPPRKISNILNNKLQLLNQSIIEKITLLHSHSIPKSNAKAKGIKRITYKAESKAILGVI